MRNRVPLLVLSAALAGLAGCQSPSGALEGGTALSIETATPENTLTPQERYPTAGVVAQWGASAEASSQFADPEWSPGQAVGPPDSPGCGDYQFAWASAASDSLETLEVAYQTPVYPLQITIHESYNPDQVVKVEVQNPETGVYYTVLQKNPRQVDRPCPFQLVVPVEGITFKTSLVRITIDQTQLGLGWNEIDAVELVGSISLPDGQAAPGPTSAPD